MKGKGRDEQNKLIKILKNEQGLKNLDYKDLLAKDLFLKHKYGDEYKKLYAKYEKDLNKTVNQPIEKSDKLDDVIDMLKKIHHYNKLWTTTIHDEQALRQAENVMKDLQKTKSKIGKKNKKVFDNLIGDLNDAGEYYRRIKNMKEKAGDLRKKNAANKIGTAYKESKQKETREKLHNSYKKNKDDVIAAKKVTGEYLQDIREKLISPYGAYKISKEKEMNKKIIKNRDHVMAAKKVTGEYLQDIGKSIVVEPKPPRKFKTGSIKNPVSVKSAKDI